MEPNNVPPESQQEKPANPLHQVTPLSKYLAMALFIAMPFVGVYIGYTYAPEKVIEREVVREIEKTAESIVIEPYTTERGIVIDGRELQSYTLKDFVNSEENLDSFLTEIGNTYALNETFKMTGYYRTYEKSAWGETQQCHGLKLRQRPTNFWHLKTLLSTLGGNSVNHLEEKSLVINLRWSELSEADKQKISSGDEVTLELSAREPVFTSVGPCYSGFEFKQIIE